MTTKVLEVDLAKGIEFIPWDEKYQAYRILVRVGINLLGWLNYRNKHDGISSDDIRKAVFEKMGRKLTELEFHERFDKKSQLNHQPISVVVCTRNRSKQLENCLRYLKEMDYPEYEIIVVDNAPDNDDTRNLVSDMDVVYVNEPRPGLDWARNAGIFRARYSLIAFTDDDVQVDRYWLQAIAKTFEDEEVMAASGFVAPAEMETEAQHIFELGYGGMGHGFKRKYLRRSTLSPKQRLWASSFGIGANMAFRAKLFPLIGAFDTALDVGTPSHGGGDVEIFHRIVNKGFLMVYEPSMLVWHYHRREMSKLKKQLFDNGRSFGCYLTDCARKKTERNSTIISFLVKEWFLNWILKNLVRPGRIPRSLTLMEIYGMITSPMAYTATKKRDKAMKQQLYNAGFPDETLKNSNIKTFGQFPQRDTAVENLS